VRRQVLALDAAQYGDRDLAARITAVPVDDGADTRWGVEWATGSTVDHRFRQALTGHDSEVRAVATAVVEGRPVAVTGSRDGTVRVWDLATGRPVGRHLVFPRPVRAVAVSPDGRLVVGFGWEVAVLAPR
jgi:WD40 repeat protein